MRTATLRPAVVRPTGRLDALHFLAAGVVERARLASAALAGLAFRPLGGVGGFASVSRPKRLKGVFAASPEEGVPFLRPTDVFEYFPVTTDHLSTAAHAVDDYRIGVGQILQTRSGRNLGPSALGDAFLAKYAVSDDMLRVNIDDERLRFYAFAWLQTSTALNVLRLGKTGSVIDHIDEPHMRAQQIPMFDDVIIDGVSADMKRAFDLRERARLKVASLLSEFEALVPKLHRSGPLRAGWTLRARDTKGRLDAAFHDPLVSSIRSILKANGGVELGTVARVIKPTGRYKTCYVEKEYGQPMLSGSHLLQSRPMKLQYISTEALTKPERYALKKGWTVFQADGRAEESLAVPVMVTPDRDGWLASGHVGRLVPRDGVDPGWLYLATMCATSQLQLKTLACGSVVDALYPDAIAGVVLPPKDHGSGEAMATAWGWFGEAQEAEESAVEAIELALDEACSRHPAPPGAMITRLG